MGRVLAGKAKANSFPYRADGRAVDSSTGYSHWGVNRVSCQELSAEQFGTSILQASQRFTQTGADFSRESLEWVAGGVRELACARTRCDSGK